MKYKNLLKNILAVVLIFALLASFASLFYSPFEQPEEITLGKVAREVKEGNVETIEVSGNELTVTLKDGTEEKAMKEAESSLSETLKNFGVTEQQITAANIEPQGEGGAKFWLGIIVPFVIPFLIIGFVLWFMMRGAQRGAGQAMNFGKSKAKLFGGMQGKKQKVRFSDVADEAEAKEELKEIVEFLKKPKKFLQMGARIPKGLMLMGPPGSGKTLLARAISGEAEVPFYSISGSEFVEMFVGVGASRVRDLFENAKKNAPSIIFVDEIDAVGRLRGAGLGGGNDEREQTLNQILSEMDGFEQDTNVIVLAATNRPDVLDPALLRPGRFDRRIVIDLPDIRAREQILKLHAKNSPVASNVDFKELASRTPGFSGADLENLVNEAAIFAARRKKKQVGPQEFYDAIEKVILGPERKTKVFSEKDKKVAAFHEAGHAVVAHSLPNSDPVRKVSIISRGGAGGYTLKTPEEETSFRTRKQFIAELAVLLGGYASEELFMNQISTGASNDLEKASQLARKLVTQYGMSKKLGPVVFGEKDETVFLGKELSEQKNYSEDVAYKIDQEISKLIKDAYQTAKKLLKERKGSLEKLADYLVEKETIERKEFEKLLGEPAST